MLSNVHEVQAQKEHGATGRFYASLFALQARQPNHRLQIGEGASRADAIFEMRHVAAGGHLHIGLRRGWLLGVSCAYYWSKATTSLSASVGDSSGVYGSSAYDDTGYVSDPFQFDARSLLAHDRYVPIQAAVSLGKQIKLSPRYSLRMEPALGFMPVASYRIGGTSAPDPRDPRYGLASATYDTDGEFNPYASISVVVVYGLSRSNHVFLGMQFLSTFRPFYLRDLSVAGSSTGSRYTSEYRNLVWFAASLGYELNWGKPPSERRKRDYLDRAPYWPG